MAVLRTLIHDWQCRRLTAALVDYADGALARSAAGKVERHLAGCARCRDALAALRQVPAAVRQGAPACDERFWAGQRQAILDAIDAASAAPPVGRGWRVALPSAALPLAAGAVLATAGVLSVWLAARRATPATPAAIGRDDLAVLNEVASLLSLKHGWLREAEPAERELEAEPVLYGVLQEGWIDDGNGDGMPPDWGELRADELEALQALIG